MSWRTTNGGSLENLEPLMQARIKAATAEAWIPPTADPKDELVQGLLGLVERMEFAAEKIESHANSDNAKREAASEILRAVRREAAWLLRYERWRGVAIAVAAAVVVSVVLWLLLRPSDPLCFNQNGGTFCGHWTVPEKGKS